MNIMFTNHYHPRGITTSVSFMAEENMHGMMIMMDMQKSIVILPKQFGPCYEVGYVRIEE